MIDILCIASCLTVTLIMTWVMIVVGEPNE